MLCVPNVVLVLSAVFDMYMRGGVLRGFTMPIDSLTPALGGPVVVASGLELTMGVS